MFNLALSLKTVRQIVEIWLVLSPKQKKRSWWSRREVSLEVLPACAYCFTDKEHPDLIGVFYINFEMCFDGIKHQLRQLGLIAVSGEVRNIDPHVLSTVLHRRIVDPRRHHFWCRGHAR